jgi:hypothetical protein
MWVFPKHLYFGLDLVVGMIPWIAIAVGVLVLMLGVVFVLRLRYGGRMPPTDYYAWFLIGIVWMSVGIVNVVLMGPGQSFFFVMGLGFAIAGLVHKKEWKANRRAWHKMDKKRRLLIIISMIVLAAVIAAAIALTIIRH